MTQLRKSVWIRQPNRSVRVTVQTFNKLVELARGLRYETWPQQLKPDNKQSRKHYYKNKRKQVRQLDKMRRYLIANPKTKPLSLRQNLWWTGMLKMLNLPSKSCVCVNESKTGQSLILTLTKNKSSKSWMTNKTKQEVKTSWPDSMRIKTSSKRRP